MSFTNDELILTYALYHFPDLIDLEDFTIKLNKLVGKNRRIINITLLLKQFDYIQKSENDEIFGSDYKELLEIKKSFSPPSHKDLKSKLEFFINETYRPKDSKGNYLLKDKNLDKYFLEEIENYLINNKKFLKQHKVSMYDRNAKISQQAIERASYMCEVDPKHTSFTSSRTGKPYVEAHHLIPVSAQEDYNTSLDIHENIIALCSNCHNELHYGINPKIKVEFLYKQRKNLLFEKGINISFYELYRYYR